MTVKAAVSFSLLQCSYHFFSCNDEESESELLEIVSMSVIVSDK